MDYESSVFGVKVGLARKMRHLRDLWVLGTVGMPVATQHLRLV